MADKIDMIDARRVILAALSEDVGGNDLEAGDITSSSVIPADLRFKGVMQARHAMVISGLPVAAEAFRMVVPEARFAARVSDGQKVAAGTVLAEIEGPARGLLTAERTALNLLQLMSGIATVTAQYAEKINGTGCTLLDTRKTIPGLRKLSKYATLCGGAKNHRMGLYDGVLIKDNHIAVCGGVGPAVRAAKSAGHPNIEAECDTLEQVAEAVEAGADIVLLDNMGPDILRQAVALVGGRCKTEASGGVTLETIRAIAETGVDFVSVGRITQSAPAVDIGLDWS
ncbi:carboxylating nicotinate-nucleotide diphosphorylase [Magnetospirillum gryphiswaldense]|uniref:Probable nicotinate-nucleotide pyrophosphorylase [carboxylating] n=2 Tax=Magnetospirillum gryphiswaldense TaxID=55518 RepID=V6F3E3_MAGGM|nr:carboxylating nicotinate-nucleotide diphosphorylase [Magnetospirillum gryphiswaldense]AVM73035.1 Nicotinate-nucleotide pyrophosphorylase [carboxylating] [Magnetospirillum gryphiswaldense MSR-1]AVM76938.1 Nicotinate-nucleotide pyrophosphorylase [carboxylating] [Magnetospirillum gryphiswaldense]CAM78218.1 Nicotinate-nucleotide pyrophosphorylase [Magnetospirillum gryphiswaldense MSR-1]CDK99008.1 quinolinate phosphoribosyltransferase (nicotinate-nucleotide pyrophosphorylase) [Magnetospirillum gr